MQDLWPQANENLKYKPAMHKILRRKMEENMQVIMGPAKRRAQFDLKGIVGN